MQLTSYQKSRIRDYSLTKTWRVFDLYDHYNPSTQLVILNKKTKVVLETAQGFDQAKNKASTARKQLGLRLEDVSFITSKGSTEGALVLPKRAKH